MNLFEMTRILNQSSPSRREYLNWFQVLSIFFLFRQIASCYGFISRNAHRSLLLSQLYESGNRLVIEQHVCMPEMSCACAFFFHFKCNTIPQCFSEIKKNRKQNTHTQQANRKREEENVAAKLTKYRNKNTRRL